MTCINDITYMYQIFGTFIITALFMMFGLKPFAKIIKCKMLGHSSAMIIDDDGTLTEYIIKSKGKTSAKIDDAKYLLQGKKALKFKGITTYLFRRGIPPTIENTKEGTFIKETEDNKPVEIRQAPPFAACTAEELENLCMMENMSGGLMNLFKKYRTLFLVFIGMAIAVAANLFITFQMHNGLNSGELCPALIPAGQLIRTWQKRTETRSTRQKKSQSPRA